MQEKLKLKDLIKKYESEFVKINGRTLSKEDREFHKEDFEKYKVSPFVSLVVCYLTGALFWSTFRS